MEIIGYGRKLHNEESHDLYFAPDITRVIKSHIMRKTKHVACINDKNSYRVVVGNLDGKMQHGWEDNIKTGLKETGCQGIDWIQLAQVGTNAGFLNMVMAYIHFLNKPSNALAVCEHILLHSKHSCVLFTCVSIFRVVRMRMHLQLMCWNCSTVKKQSFNFWLVMTLGVHIILKISRLAEEMLAL